jgi:hypothetical protein
MGGAATTAIRPVTQLQRSRGQRTRDAKSGAIGLRESSSGSVGYAEIHRRVVLRTAAEDEIERPNDTLAHIEA